MAWIMYLGMMLCVIAFVMNIAGVAVRFVFPTNRKIAQSLMGYGGAMAVVGLTLLIVASIIHVEMTSRLTHRCIAHIENLGGTVIHDTGWGSTVYEMVYLDDTTATDDDLKYVRQLNPGFGVYLRSTKITDAGLSYLHGLRLYEIDLTGTNISDAAIDNLLDTLPRNCRIERPQ